MMGISRKIISMRSEAHPSIHGADFADNMRRFGELCETPEFTWCGINTTPIDQETDYTCGASTVRTLLKFYGQDDPGEVEIAKELEINTDPKPGDILGANPEKIRDIFQKRGFEVEYGTGLHKDNMFSRVIKSLKDKSPLIALWNGWGGHYSVITGIYLPKVEELWPNARLFLADSTVQWTHTKDLNPGRIVDVSAWYFKDSWVHYKNENPKQSDGDISVQTLKVFRGLYIIPTLKKESE
jgi:hypothetical protein